MGAKQKGMWFLVALVAITVACKKDPPEVVEAKEHAASVDREIAEDFRGDKHAEARAWFGRPHVMGFKMSVNEMRELAEAIYGAGAPRVEVVGISHLGESEIAAVFAVELPADAASRKRVFDWYASWAAAQEEKPEIDVGQKYLKVVLD
jgi:hypothetical protein